jgi:membrane protease YdiL (CAAX protease family)
MSTAGTARPTALGPPSPQEPFVRRRPLTAFLVLVFGIGGTGLALPVVLDIPADPFLLLLLVALTGAALVVTRLADGPGAPRKLLSRVLLWRFGVGRWAVILFGVPLLTLAIAAVSGTLSSPSDGWAVEIGWYLFNTLVFGALAGNVWEELGWAGFAQSRLMARHGLLVGSLATAVFFAGIHVPLYLQGKPTWSELALGLAVLFAVAPVYRCPACVLERGAEARRGGRRPLGLAGAGGGHPADRAARRRTASPDPDRADGARGAEGGGAELDRSTATGR